MDESDFFLNGLKDLNSIVNLKLVVCVSVCNENVRSVSIQSVLR